MTNNKITATSKKKKAAKRPKITCAVFDKYHKHIYCGTSHGRLLIIEYSSWKIINSSTKNKITNSQQQIKSIVFSRCGRYIVVNCGDRIIRYIDVEGDGSSYKLRKAYKDAVESKNWNACCFSSNGEYICAASAKQQCIIYIWQRCYERSLEKVLKADTINSYVVDMVWHPIQPILITVTQNGEIQIWNENFHETGKIWSTFDANFEVLTENVWYRDKDKLEHMQLNKHKHNKGSSHSSSIADTSSESEREGNHMENEHKDGNESEDIDEELWLNEQINKADDKEDGNVVIDIFNENGNLDFLSGDEDENDLLDPVNDSLKRELIHLGIDIKCPYSSQEISQYLAI